MEKEKVRRALRSLPVIGQDTEVCFLMRPYIEDEIGRVRYKITKEVLPENRRTVLMLTVSGPEEDRRGLINLFKEILGPPQSRSKTAGEATCLYWDVEVLKNE